VQNYEDFTSDDISDIFRLRKDFVAKVGGERWKGEVLKYLFSDSKNGFVICS
jgi:hypothetical protein